ncbi:MAG: hypothetical protein LBS71_00450 [Puniceicoccales bacterium]|jgi:hypothetical protein|nr:hypothetical protein [Puniceicoccales bacterium]
MVTQKLKIISLSLLCGITSNAFLFGAAADDHIEKLREISEALVAIADIPQCDDSDCGAWLQAREIFVEDIFKPEDVTRAWSSSFQDFTKNVVRINMIKKQDELCFPYIGTGTLIDVGISDLKGRVVLTCQHCSGIEHANRTYGDSSANTVTQNDQLIAMHSKSSEGSYLEETVHLSITPQCEQSEDEIALINTLEDHQETISSREAIAVTDVYNLVEVVDGKENRRDFCIMILATSVTFGGEVVSGIPLSQPQVMDSDLDTNLIEEDLIHHTELFSKQPFIVIGYGMTGVCQPDYIHFPPLETHVQSDQPEDTNFSPLVVLVQSDQPEDTNFPPLEVHVRSGKLAERQAFLKTLGWNTKKAINLQGIHKTIGDFDEVSGCNCKFRDDAGKEITDEAEIKDEDLKLFKISQQNGASDSYCKAGGGFSGGLVITQNDGGSSYKVFAVYSGPQFTQPRKDWIRTMAIHSMSK